MTILKRIFMHCGIVMLGIAFLWACPFDKTLREYLSANFWLPFARRPANFEKKNIRRISVPFAGMAPSAGNSPLAKLRAEYTQFAQPQTETFDVTPDRKFVAAARADKSLTRREREEVDLIDAKIDMRAGLPEKPELLESARKKFEAFIRTAQTPEFRSEARGWLARVHFLLGNQTAAGKLYLDELNRNGSNLSRETLLISLRMTYGYDGGRELADHIHEYFDTPEHAAFALQLLPNPHLHRNAPRFEGEDNLSRAYPQIKALLNKHSDLFKSEDGANALALLAMRTALRMGDPPEARKIAEAIPAGSAIRSEPDFNWMLASALFLSHEYAASESPLLSLFRSARSSQSQKAAAAYALCGVYMKTRNDMERLRYAQWLNTASKGRGDLTYPSSISDLSIYYAISGWDLNMLLETESPIDVLETFVSQNPSLPDIRLVKYSLAVRLTRENRYQEAAELYQSINAAVRAPRIRSLAALYEATNRPGLSDSQKQQALYRFAEFLSGNPNRIYFNDALWSGFQTYALTGSSESRLTGAERRSLIQAERKLKDDQEELWRAHMILIDIARNSPDKTLARKSALLAIKCLQQISDRFDRQDEIREAGLELFGMLRKQY